MRARVSVVASAVVVLGIGTSSARAGDGKLADRLFREALQAADAGNWDVACPKFRESFGADPSVGALLNMASCDERAGRLLQAKAQYTEAFRLNDGTPDPARKQAVRLQAQQAIESLDRRIPRIQIAVSPPVSGARVTVDGRTETPPPGGVQVDPGAHEVVVDAEGFQSINRQVRLVESQVLPVAITLTAVSSAPAEPAPDAGGGVVVSVPGVVLLAVGAAGMGMFAGFGVSSQSAGDTIDAACPGRTNCDASLADTRDAGERDQLIANISLGVGLASLVAGFTVWIVEAATDTSSTPAGGEAMAVMGFVTPTAAGAGVIAGAAGRF